MKHNIMRPMLKNWPEVKDDERVVDCSKCGQQCIERPRLEAEARAAIPNIGALCTECALKDHLNV